MSVAVGVVEHLNNIKAKLGEETFRTEVRRLAKTGIKMGGKHELFWRDLVKQYEWLDVEELLASSDPTIGNSTTTSQQSEMLMQAMRQQMPGLKTQAQFNAALAVFDTVRMTLNYIFDGNATKAAEAKQALDLALDAATKITEITKQLEDVPEAATSPAAQEFKTPPAQFMEYDTQKALLVELEQIASPGELSLWYGETKSRRDQIKSQTLRDTLLDTIRAKKRALEGGMVS
jgi:hypothetical protein